MLLPVISLLVILLVIALAVSIPGLLILCNTLLKSSYIYAGGEKREYTSNSNKNIAEGKRLFIKAFYKYFSNSNTLNNIKGANKLATLFLVIGIGVLGL